MYAWYFYSLITSYSNFNWGAYNQPNLTLSLRRFLAVVQQVSLLYDCFWIDSIDPMFFCIFLGGAKGKYIYAYIFWYIYINRGECGRWFQRNHFKPKAKHNDDVELRQIMSLYTPERWNKHEWSLIIFRRIC